MRKTVVSILCSLAIILFLATATQAVRASTLIVDSLADDENDGCGVNNCTLREAIADAANGDTIEFSVTGTITLTSDQLVIQKDLTINGPGEDLLTISGDDLYRVMWIRDGEYAVTLRNLTMAGGLAPLLEVPVFGENGIGGGLLVESSGAVAVENVTFRENWAYLGGGLGSIQTVDSTSLSLSHVTFTGNTALDKGGGMDVVGSPILTDVTFVDNECTAIDGRGGGMEVRKTGSSPILTDVIFSENRAGRFGGGLYIFQASPTLNRVTFTNNSNTLSCPDCSGGGINVNQGSAELTNVTLSGNSSAYGSGITLYAGNVELTNVTISGNSASPDGGALLVDTIGTISLTNTILADNWPSDCSISYGGQLLSGDYNLIENNTGCTITGATSHDLIGVDPDLKPLSDNGGATLTHALPSTSPAVDWIPNGVNGCGTSLTSDQRGAPRPMGAALRCDIGAYERGLPEIAIMGDGQAISDGDATPALSDLTDFGEQDVNNDSISHSFTITNTGDETLNLDGVPRIEILGPAAADFSLTVVPENPLGEDEGTSFEITFDPSATGLRTAYVAIANDDPDENLYTFAIQGTGTGTPNAMTIMNFATSFVTQKLAGSLVVVVWGGLGVVICLAGWWMIRKSVS